MNEASDPKPLSESSQRAAKVSERYLTFSLCDEEFAIPLLQVKEVIAYSETTPIPYAPSYFKGILNLRGQVISVLDLRTKLKLSKSETGAETSIIILDLAPLCLGVIVDSIDSVMALTLEEMSPRPDVELTVKEDYITGIARKDKRLILILDVKSILNFEDMKSLKSQMKAA